MAISVNTNLGSMIIQGTLNKNTAALNKNIERMTTGLKVNKAADNAAIMSIAKGLETEIRGSQVAESSIQTGMNILQTAESDLSLIEDHVSRVRDLATQAASDFYTPDARAAMAAEAQACVDEINRLSGGSNFNGINLLDGSSQSMRLQIGAGADGSTNAIDVGTALDDASAAALGITTTIENAFASASSAANFISECDVALNHINNRLSTIGATQNRLTSAYDSLTVKTQNLYAARSSIMDADIAQESSLYTRNMMLQNAAASLLVQANQAPSVALSLI